MTNRAACDGPPPTYASWSDPANSNSLLLQHPQLELLAQTPDGVVSRERAQRLFTDRQGGLKLAFPSFARRGMQAGRSQPLVDDVVAGVVIERQFVEGDGCAELAGFLQVQA